MCVHKSRHKKLPASQTKLVVRAGVPCMENLDLLNVMVTDSVHPTDHMKIIVSDFFNCTESYV